MALLSLEAMGRRNVAGPLLLLNLALYVSMMGFASWALNSFVDDIGDQEYYPPADDACMCTGTPAGAAGPRSAGDEATLHFIQLALLAAVLGSAAKAAAAFHASASWRPQGLAAVAALGTVAWAATALALGLACKEMRVTAAAAARGWQMRALEAITATLAVTQLAYVLMLHRAAAADADEADTSAADADATACSGDQCEPGCSTATEGDDDVDCQDAQHQQQQHGRRHHHRQGGGPACSVM
ncbi:membrane protein PM19L-like [Miscanthus floridulus]|uniref:membrane protein PM19L-like n=1 Tax=Miscanthus floridulus TaxID=154761 RepID=UPI00345A4A69